MQIEIDNFIRKISIFSLFVAIPAILLPIAFILFFIEHLIEEHKYFAIKDFITIGLISLILIVWFSISLFYTIRWLKKSVIQIINEHKSIYELQQRSLNEKDELIRKISSATPVGVVLVERGKIKWCNEYALSLFGIEEKIDLASIDISSFFRTPQEYEDINKFFLTQLKSQDLLKFDTVLIKKDNSPIDVHIEATALDKEDPFKGIVVSITDISKLKKAEMDLKYQLNFFQTLIDTIPSPVFYKDSNMIYKGCNKEFEKLLGLSSDEIVNKSVFDLAPRHLAETYHNKDMELFNKGGIQEYEAIVNYADGSIRDVIFNKSVYSNAEGEPAGIIGIIHDITERKKMETIISNQEILYRRIFDESPLGKSMVDLNSYKFVKVNKSLCKMLEYTKEELLNLTVSDITHPDDIYLSEKYIQGIINAEYEYINFEKRYIKKSGTLIWVKINLSIIRDIFEPSIYALGIIEDISLQKKALEDIRLFRNALDRAGDSIFLLNPNSFRIIDTNQRACIAYGYDRDQLIGKKITDIQANIDDQTVLQHFEQVIADKDKIIVVKMNHTRSNGKEFPVEIQISSTTFEEKPVVVFVVRDITERSKLERDLIFARERALEVSRLKSEFVANMSHEIRTPLNGIIGIIDMLSQSELNDEQHDLVKTLKESSNSLLAIINDILDLSKIEAGKLSIDHDLFDTSSLIENSVDVFSSRAYEKNLQLAVYIDKEVPPLLEGPQNRIKQVLLNLINNAVKFTDEGYVFVNVYAEKTDDALFDPFDIILLCFEVKDTGIGMDRETVDNLFQPFVQADSSSSRQHSGTGLGLYISKKLIELMGGDISVESEVKRGTTFRFNIPCIIPSQKKHEEAFCKLLPFNTLIISDRETESYALLSYLNDMGMKSEIIPSCEDGIDFLSKIDDETMIHIVIVNVNHVCTERCNLLSAKLKNPKIHSTRFILADYETKNKKMPSHLLDYDAFIRRPIKKSYLYHAIVEAITDKDDKKLYLSMDEDKKEILQPQESKPKEKLILLAEDNLINQKVATMQLNKLGYSVDIANNGKEVLEKLKTNNYDLILMDCQMPIIDGLETTKRIRLMETRTGRHIPIIAMTANAMAEDKEKCLAVGMNDYISKPVNISLLETTIKQWID